MLESLCAVQTEQQRTALNTFISMVTLYLDMKNKLIKITAYRAIIELLYMPQYHHADSLYCSS